MQCCVDSLSARIVRQRAYFAPRSKRAVHNRRNMGVLIVAEKAYGNLNVWPFVTAEMS